MLSAGKLTESWLFSLVLIDCLWGARLRRAPEQQELVLVIRPELSGLAGQVFTGQCSFLSICIGGNTVKLGLCLRHERTKTFPVW